MGTSNPTLLFSLALVALVLSFRLALADSGHSPVKYSFHGPDGPDKWASLSPEFEKCGSGKFQSPIDINEKEVVGNETLGKLDAEYIPTRGTLINTGHNIGLRFDELETGEITVEGKTYKLTQMHWHTPSEHTINGHQYPLELHVVHKAEDGSLSVVAVLYEYSEEEDPILKKVKKELVEIGEDKCSPEEESQVEVKKLKLKFKDDKPPCYYRYYGSLTFPPCTESVIWTVISKIMSVTKEQVKSLTDPLDENFKKNSRPVQPLYGRKVERSMHEINA